MAEKMKPDKLMLDVRQADAAGLSYGRWRFEETELVQDHAAFLPSYARMTVRKPIWACTPHERRNALSDPPKPKVEGLLDQDRPAALLSCAVGSDMRV